MAVLELHCPSWLWICWHCFLVDMAFPLRLLHQQAIRTLFHGLGLNLCAEARKSTFVVFHLLLDNCGDLTHIFAWKCQKVWKNGVTSISSCKSAHCGRRRRRRHRGRRRHRHRHHHYPHHHHHHHHHHHLHHHHLLLILLLHLHHRLKNQDRIIENHAVFQNFNLSRDATTVAWTCLDMTMAWGDTQAALGFGPPDKQMPANEKWNASFAFGPSWRWLSLSLPWDSRRGPRAEKAIFGFAKHTPGRERMYVTVQLCVRKSHERVGVRGMFLKLQVMLTDSDHNFPLIFKIDVEKQLPCHSLSQIGAFSVLGNHHIVLHVQRIGAQESLQLQP